MDFGKNLLKKYGWQEGSGLGKNSDGITKPLRANLKFDRAGLGENKSDEFNNNWWDRAFTEAARNLEVSKEGENVTIGVKNKDSIKITTKPHVSKTLSKTRSQNGYNSFIKKSVLSGLKETAEDSSDSDSDDPDVSVDKTYPYEEWFKACDGLTAHKGARHGLTLKGKLYRIEQQEKELLARFEDAQKYLSERNWPYAHIEKQKNLPRLDDPESFSSDQNLSKKKSKKDEKDDDKLSVAVDCTLDASIQDVMLPKKNKKRKKETAEESTQTCIFDTVIQKTAKKEKSLTDTAQKRIKKKEKIIYFANKSTMI